VRRTPQDKKSYCKGDQERRKRHKCRLYFSYSHTSFRREDLLSGKCSDTRGLKEAAGCHAQALDEEVIFLETEGILKLRCFFLVFAYFLA
jgi:hypothetical protein